jgi:hypothetical protein
MVGNGYKDFPNIVWMHGNDFQSRRDATDDALVQAVTRGIRSTNENHIHTLAPACPTPQILARYSWLAIPGSLFLARYELRGVSGCSNRLNLLWLQ